MRIKTLINSLGVHRNIVRLYDTERQDSSTWLFMEYCEYGTLQRYFTSHHRVLFREHLSFASGGLSVCWGATTFGEQTVFFDWLRGQEILEIEF